MNNKYLQLLEKMSLDQLHTEVQATQLLEPDKTAVVYDHLVDRVEDFNNKLQYQRLATRYQQQSKQLQGEWQQMQFVDAPTALAQLQDTNS